MKKIYGARGDSGAIASGDFIDLTNIPQEQLERLPFTPGSAIGTSRTPLVEADYKAIAESLKKHNIKWLLFNGGNGSMDACGKVAAQVKDTDIRVVGIPKTIDNDIAITDHAPGFGSAARYLAASVRELCYDVASLPIHVAVIEAMGRNAGWLTAASALAGETAVMVGFRRLSASASLQQGYNSETFLIPVEEVMLKERTLEERYISPSADGITQEFIQWCSPLIGGELPEFPRFT